jgi:hypothetical protein
MQSLLLIGPETDSGIASIDALVRRNRNVRGPECIIGLRFRRNRAIADRTATCCGDSLISSTSMQNSIPRPHILFIDGLPGSGKSTAAEAVRGYLPKSRVFAESAPDHPLLVAAPDRMGAAFADIHEIHSADSFAAAALGRLESFLESAGCDVPYVFESHPIQSTVRVLFQLDARQTTILQFWSDLQDRLALVQPRLIYFQESNPLQAIKEIARMRGPIWEGYFIESFNQTPWMRARALSGVEGADRMIVAYADLIDQLADLWRFPMLKLPARPENYEARTGALTKWAVAPVPSDRE